MPKTFATMVAEAMAVAPAVNAHEAKKRMLQDPLTLMVDMRDASDLPATGIIPGAVNISYGALTYKADQEMPPEWRDERVQDRQRPIITTCYTGELAALGAKLLIEMGFERVSYLSGGTVGWSVAGYPTQPV